MRGISTVKSGPTITLPTMPSSTAVASSHLPLFFTSWTLAMMRVKGALEVAEVTPGGSAGAVWVLSTMTSLPSVGFAQRGWSCQQPDEKLFTESAQCWST